jgi:hypothetical protein
MRAGKLASTSRGSIWMPLYGAALVYGGSDQSSPATVCSVSSQG